MRHSRSTTRSPAPSGGRGASPHEIARTRFNNYGPLLRLGRLADVDRLLRDCHEAFDTAGDTTRLAMVYGARAELADKRDNPAAAIELQRSALRLCYLHPDPREISAAHHNLAPYLSRTAGNPAEQHTHRLTAALLGHLISSTGQLTRPFGTSTEEPRSETSGPGAPAHPTTLSELTPLVEADDGVRFGDLLSLLCPVPATAEHALAKALTSMTTPGQSHQQPKWNQP